MTNLNDFTSTYQVNDYYKFIINPFLKDKIEQFLSEITEDGHQIVKKVQEVMKLDKSERENVDQDSRVIKTKKGRLDVIGRLNEIEFTITLN